ncbi:MAG: hypothetical protein JWM98_2038 [Thermoleophilia bacterium]|nr:hypothetical protein [Thermoleophilia bacterium]
MGCSCSGTATTPSVMVPAPAAPAPAPTAPTASVAPAGPAAPVGTAPAPTAATYVQAGRSTTGLTPLMPGPHTATPGRLDLLTPADAGLVDRALGFLRQSPTGAPVLEAMTRYRVKLQVLDDARFAALGHDDAAAYYDTSTDTMSIRRSWLQDKPEKTASLIAHEGTHAVDDASGLGAGALQSRIARIKATPGVTPAQVAQLTDQASWEVSVAKESRAYLVQGQVLRELHQDDPTKMGGAVLVAAQGANDHATYDKVFTTIVGSAEGGYNPQGRKAAPFAL